MYCFNRGAILRREETASAYMTFVRCRAEKGYAERLTKVVPNGLYPANTECASHSLKYVLFSVSV